MDTVAFYRHRQIGWAMVVPALIPFFILLLSRSLTGFDAQIQHLPGASQPMLLIALAVPLLAVAFFSSLEITLDQSSLMLRFGLGGLIRKRWLLASIDSATPTRTTFGQGWGIHRRAGVTLYNVSGFGAVKVLLKDGSSVLIGSDEPEQLAQSITNLVREQR